MEMFEEVKRKVLEMFKNPTWVKWVHEGTTPAYTHAEKQANIAFSESILGKHCSICLNLNGCCFPANNMPEYPLHPNCHCKAEAIRGINANAKCPLSKFDDFIFHPDKINNKGKKALFESWGYAKINSEWLQEELIKQAQEKYANGDFKLGKLDEHGQRINIEIVLPRKDKIGTVTFTSGWMVYPDGVIQNITPYGGKRERI